jgi:type II secretory pathway component PulF
MIGIVILAIIFGIIVYALLTSKQCPYKWQTDICKDCPFIGEYCDNANNFY